jgi:hypothetical protein
MKLNLPVTPIDKSPLPMQLRAKYIYESPFSHGTLTVDKHIIDANLRNRRQIDNTCHKPTSALPGHADRLLSSFRDLTHPKRKYQPERVYYGIYLTIGLTSSNLIAAISFYITAAWHLLLDLSSGSTMNSASFPSRPRAAMPTSSLLRGL